MDEDLKELARRVNRLGGVGMQFERIVDGVLAHVCATLGAPAPGGGAADDVVDAELAGARARLLEFQDEFEDVVAAAIMRRLAADDLAAAAVVLATEGARRFLSAQAQVAKDAEREIQALLNKMHVAILLEEPSP